MIAAPRLAADCGMGRRPDPCSTLHYAKWVLRTAERRSAKLGINVAQPRWLMLVDLWRAGAERKDVSVSSLCLASGVPPTTALRQIADMVEAGLIREESDPTDRRRRFLRLTEAGARTVEDQLVEELRSFGRG